MPPRTAIFQRKRRFSGECYPPNARKDGFDVKIRLWAIILAVFLLISCNSGAKAWYGSRAPYIRWVEFHPSAAAIRQAVDYDRKSYGTPAHADYVTVLALAAARTGGEFPAGRSDAVAEVVRRLGQGERAEDIAESLPYFGYYLEAYDAAIGFLLREGRDSGGAWTRIPAAYSPIAAGYGYSHCRDFGNVRSFGYRRPHLGNDLCGAVGTPIVAVEGGTVEALGWNRYGGWRVGIRSDDGRRYWYYAHLRRGHPYAEGMAEGVHVDAGDVIGYLGCTGYSDREDTNNMSTPHLHLGLQLIFDESQKDSDNEIWIDVYGIVEYLSSRRASVAAVPEAVPADAAEPARVALPVVMYHSVLRSPNAKSDYIISPDTIRADIAWLLAHGYTPVTLADVIAFADGEGTLPPKPVVLTFDDGYLNNAVYLPAIAAEFGVPMLISAVGRFADDAETDPDRCPSYAMLRWSDYRALRDDGHFEIANHTYDMHRLSPRKGASRRPGESAADYRATLERDLRLMQTRLADELGSPAQVFVYPFGALSPESEDVLRELGFRAALTCCDTANFITSGLAEHGEGGLLVLGRLNRAPGLSTEEYMRRLLRHYE